ncbi:MAG: MarR family transcriptional regulator [Anaerolineales bacterium]|nr:MarR family transcriptional regulator [Anaerolineales bacterium]
MDAERALLAGFLQTLARRYLLLEYGLVESVNDLTKSEFQTMELIALEGITTVSELAKAGKVPMSTASWHANRLVERGYLVRRPDPDDRRTIRLELTAKGRKVLSGLNRAFEAMAAELLAGATASERKVLLKLARRLTRELPP